jgi:hypothetical protein
VPEVGSFRGAEHRVRVEDQVDVVTDGGPQRLRGLDRLDDRCPRIPVRERVVVERGQRGEAQRGESLLPPAERILCQLLRGAPCQVAVDAHAPARGTAEEVVNGNAEPLSLQIPQRDVDPGDGAHDHLSGRPERASDHLAPPVLDFCRVLPYEQLAEVVEDAQYAAPAPGQARLADARQPLVGADEHDEHGIVVTSAHPHG